MQDNTKKKIVIVGGGFGGIQAARLIGRSGKAEVTVLDRKNHFLFQPLLYQVATASLSPSDIGTPIRQVLAPYRNVRVHLETALSVDLAAHTVTTDSDTHAFDYLVLACGSTHSYFGRDEWEELAPGLKTIEHALEIRRRILTAFERAEKEPDPARHASLMTFVVIGGGPTGVELAGALTELGRGILSEEFRNIRPEQLKVILIQGADRLLPSFHPTLSEKARLALESRGVEVLLGKKAEDLGPDRVRAGGRLIETATVLWAAGVRPASLNATLGLPLDREGRVPVGGDLSIPGHGGVFVIGDQARFDAPEGPLPGLAPVAMQQGRAAARNILCDLKGQPRKPFRYVDKGTLAVIGRGFAVSQVRALLLSGYPAWLIWVFVHIGYLIGHRNRIAVLFTWAWSYMRFKRGSRLITYRAWKESEAPRAAFPVHAAPQTREAVPASRG